MDAGDLYSDSDAVNADECVVCSDAVVNDARSKQGGLWCEWVEVFVVERERSRKEAAAVGRARGKAGAAGGQRGKARPFE